MPFCASVLLLVTLCFNFIIVCLAVPIRTKDSSEYGFQWSDSAVLGIVIGASSLICFIIFGILCVCCGSSNFLFKTWNRQNQCRRNLFKDQNGFPSGSEISVFPHPSISHQLSSSNEEIHFEALPDVTSKLGNSKNSQSVVDHSEDWFAEPHKNFPRAQLQYVRILGTGWFGQILFGRATGIDADHISVPVSSKFLPKPTPVVVKSLREDASPEEQALFLKELKPYRDLNDRNVLRVLGYSLEKHPYLIMLQFCSKGDLKSILRKDGSITDSTLIGMSQDVSAGLAHMHEHNFIHTDLAARNCLVEEDMTVKIGDYGFGIDTGSYKDEYYLAENVALPIRWCAPETLKCTESTIETIPLSKEANIWSLGVLIWEIVMRGELPYADLDEESVIQQVILDGSVRLKAPSALSDHLRTIDTVLNKCWTSSSQRPDAAHINSLLTHGCSNVGTNDSSLDFESRWNQLNKEKISKDHSISIRNSEINSSHVSVPKSPTPSLNNFHGSAEDLDARVAAKFGSAVPSWLGLGPDQPMDSLTEEITDAIQRLDEALADKNSYASSSLSSPDKSCSLNFKFGKDSLVLNPPGGSLTRTLSDGEDENLTMRLEQGEFSELVRLKSQSVQDFMRLTVVDDGSDSDKTSQPGSLLGDFNAQNLIPEKTFSSESNLKEAIRDSGFMVELEKLQAEHKYSIISEVSRDGPASFEFNKPHHREVQEAQSGSEKESSYGGLISSYENRDWDSFLGVVTTSSEGKDEVVIEAVTPKEMETLDKEVAIQQQASPDCVLSSRRALNCATLPDVIAHNANMMFLSTSSSSSLTEETSECLTEIEDTVKPKDTDDVGSLSCHLRAKLKQTKEGYGNILSECKEKDVSETLVNVHDSILNEGLSEKDVNCTHCCSDACHTEKSPMYNSEQVVRGEDVVFGALDDYSLEYFRSAKSSVVENECDTEEESQLESVLISNDCSLSTKITSCSEDSGIGNSIQENCNVKNCESSTIVTVKSDFSDCNIKESESQIAISSNTIFNGRYCINNSVTDSLVNNLDKLDLNSTDSLSRVAHNDSSEIVDDENKLILGALQSPDKIILKCNLDVALDDPAISDSGGTSLDRFVSMTERDLNFNSKFDCRNMQDKSDNSVYVSESQSDSHCQQNSESHVGLLNSNSSSKFTEKDHKGEFTDQCGFSPGLKGSEFCVSACNDNENEEFWERQMTAWHEAAVETRELLLEAATKEYDLGDSEDDIVDIRSSPQTPRSEGGSTKSPFSSTDKLDIDEEGTYISYDTTDDEEVLRYSPEDINALRSELCLMLGDSDESPKHVEEEPSNDIVFINYRGSRSTLSPIKEEACDDINYFSPASESNNDSSIEFTENNKSDDGSLIKPCDDVLPSNNESGISSPLTPVANIPLSARENSVSDLAAEEAKDSLILEDLESEGTPDSARVIVGPIQQEENSEDLLVIDTETNKVTLIDSGRPQAMIAFLLDREDEDKLDSCSQDQNIFFDAEEDVAPESLPYESSSWQFNYCSTKESQMEADNFDTSTDNQTLVDDMPYYHNYFTSGLTSLPYPTPSLDGNDVVEPAQHKSLPYDVNFPSAFESNEPKKNIIKSSSPDDCDKVETNLADASTLNGGGSVLAGEKVSTHHLVHAVPGDKTLENNDKNIEILDTLDEKIYAKQNEKETQVCETINDEGRQIDDFITLSFLGRLYYDENVESQNEDSEVVISATDGEKSTMALLKPDNICYSVNTEEDESDSDLEEDLPPEAERNEEVTPLRTPSHLIDFVWRAEEGPSDPRYTPDWETDSENNDEFESSSTSGEFVWQPGDSEMSAGMCYPSVDKVSTDWQSGKREEESEEAECSEEESESGEEDFTPSTWNRQLTPQRSLLKSPETSSNEKKSVHWKRQRHHRVYEYPPEPQSWHAEVPTQSSRPRWTPYSLDYFNLADLELGEDFIGDDSEDFEEYFSHGPVPYGAAHTFNLAPPTYDRTSEAEFLGDSCEFYIGSPGTPFAFSRSSFTPSDFFPNTDNSSSNYNYFLTDEIGEDHTTNDDSSVSGLTYSQNTDNGSDVLSKSPQSSESRLSREKLRLDLPTLCLVEKPEVTAKSESNENVTSDVTV